MLKHHLLVSIDNSVEADRKIVEQLKDYFKGIFDFTDPNLKKLNKKIIDDLVKAKVVPTEAERKAAQDKAEKAERKETENIISKIFPKRAIAKIPSEFRGTKKPTTKTAVATAAAAGSASAKGKLVWTRKKLPSSSVQGGGSGTNPTGGLRLVQDDFISGGKRLTKQVISKTCLANTHGNKLGQLLMLKPPKFLLKLLLRVSFTDSLTLK
jgi:hypothetical protein